MTVDLCVAPGELLTPTGVVLDGWGANTPEWERSRSRGIGSSDLPAILGYSNYGTAADVWARKTGRLERDEAGEAAYWGHILEPVIADEFSRRRGVEAVKVPTLHQKGHPHRLASLDRIITGCPDGGTGCVLEVKTRSAWKAGSWRDDVPDDVLAQVQWQLLVTGLPHAHVACLIDNSRYRDYLIAPEPDVMTYVATEADAVWRHVLADTRPQVDNAALLLDLLDRLHPNREGQIELDRATVDRIRGDYQLAAAAERAAVAVKAAAKAELVSLLEDANTACVDGVPVATYTPDNRTSVDTELLRTHYPEVWAACASSKATRPVLRWKKEQT